MAPRKNPEERGRALEDAFFRDENARLLESLRARQDRATQKAALAHTSGVSDDALLERLLAAGLRAETWLAFDLVPLVEVAWADREMTRAERTAVLSEAHAHGVAAGGAAALLLDHWLTERPPARLRRLWRDWAAAFGAQLSPADREAFFRETRARAEAVARASRFRLSLDRRISRAERDVLEQLFDGA